MRSAGRGIRRVGGIVLLAAGVHTIALRAVAGAQDGGRMTFEDLDREAESEDGPPGAIRPNAPKNPGPRFGEAGQLVVMSGFGATLSSATWDHSDASRFSLNVAPAL